MKQKGVEILLNELQQLDLNKISEYDEIVIDTQNHFGGPTRNIKKLIDNLSKVSLKEHKIAVFDTYLGKEYEKAVKKMEKKLTEPLTRIETPRG